MSGNKTKHEQEHMNKIAEFGCIICYKMGFPKSPCQLHHIKDKRGLSKKSSNYEVIGLCYEHHLGKTGYHTSPKKFTEKWGTQKELLELNLKLVQCCEGEICQ